MTSDTIINGKTQTSLLRFFSGEAAVTQATILRNLGNMWYTLEGWNRRSPTLPCQSGKFSYTCGKLEISLDALLI